MKAETKTNEETAIENADMEFGDESFTQVVADKGDNLSGAEKREQILKAMEFSQLNRVKSVDIVGQKFDIVDGVRGKIKGEPVAILVILREGSYRRELVSKKLNTYTEQYVEYFETFGKDETPEALKGYTFEEIEGGQAGNKPVVLRKL